MAIRPCSATLHRYPGAAKSFYPSILRGTDRASCKLTMCPRHAIDQIQSYDKYLTEVSDDGQENLYQETVSCSSCGEALTGETYSVFVTAYLGNDVRRDYFGVIHVGCFGAAQTWLGMNAPGAIVDSR